jgi:hypothetical protein
MATRPSPTKPPKEAPNTSEGKPKEPPKTPEPTPQEDTPPSVTPLVDFPPESYGDGMRAAWRIEFEQGQKGD